jgi:RNA polymerase sigma-70 factor (ECF subfamily)
VIVDERSDAEVYAQHCDELVRFATGLVGPTDAQDVVAEAMLRVMASRVWAHAENRRALMYKAVFFEARIWTRSLRRRRVRDLHASQPQVVDLPEVEPQVLRAVWQLSPMQRAVVFLTYWDDLDAGAVSALLGVSTGTVRKHLGRARDRLREVLE